MCFTYPARPAPPRPAAGFTCPSYGTYTPSICPVGTYRSQADSISCRLCPQATFQPDTGASDVSMCNPCPGGRVCGLDGMTNLSASLACPDGHTCAEGTASAAQFNHKCPGGYYCYELTTPDRQCVCAPPPPPRWHVGCACSRVVGWGRVCTRGGGGSRGAHTVFCGLTSRGRVRLPRRRYDYICNAGHVCPRGTSGALQDRNRCTVSYYCPAGTPQSFPIETRCPLGATSLSGSSVLEDCQIQPVNVCDKVGDSYYYIEFVYNFAGKQVRV